MTRAAPASRRPDPRGPMEGEAAGGPDRGAAHLGPRARLALRPPRSRPDRGARVLDLFAGSGAVGLEAVSRGAAAAVLVERDAGASRRTSRALGDAGRRGPGRSGTRGRGDRGARSRGRAFRRDFCGPARTTRDAGRRPRGRRRPAGARGGSDRPGRRESGNRVRPPGMRRAPRAAYGRNVFHFFGIL